MDGEDVALSLFAAVALATVVGTVRFVRRARSGSSGGRPKLGSLVVGNALVVLSILAVAALCGEAWLRFVYDSTDSYGMLRATDRWMERHCRRNNEGFRDDVDYDVARLPTGLRRVSFVGDSFTAGHGVKDVNDRFANRVRAARPAWQVHALAVNGLDTGRELEIFAPQMAAGRCRADLFVLVYCMNDIQDLMPDIADVGRRVGAFDPRGVLARNSWLFDWLRFVRAFATDSEVRDYFPSMAGAYAGSPWTVQRVRLRNLRAAATSHGARFAAVTFPFVNDLGPGYAFREAHRLLDGYWREEGVPALDLLPAFEKCGSRDLVVGAFDAHPNEKAHAVAAQALLPFLDGLVKK